jgi:hypothetical protein
MRRRAQRQGRKSLKKGVFSEERPNFFKFRGNLQANSLYLGGDINLPFMAILSIVNSSYFYNI